MRRLLLLALLALESWQPLRDVVPALLALAHLHNRFQDIVNARPHLLGGISVAEGEALALQTLVVDRDAKRNAELVVASVALTDRYTGLVDLEGDGIVVEALLELLEQRTKASILLKGYNEDLNRRDGRLEGHDLRISVSTFSSI